MEEVYRAVLTIVVSAILFAVMGSLFHWFTVHESQAGLLYRYGKFVRTLSAGRHRAFGTGYSLDKVDMRQLSQVVGNQEVPTKDGVPVKVSLVVRFAVSDPYLFRSKAIDPYTELHQAVQIALREVVIGMTVEDLVENRTNLAEPIIANCKEKATEVGLELQSVAVRDVILGGGIKTAMADIVKAQYEGRGALERARAEAATMRSLANTARMLDEQPALAQLRLLQAIESGKATVVIGDAAVMPKAK